MNIAARLRVSTVSGVRIAACFAVMGLAGADPAIASGGQAAAVEPCREPLSAVYQRVSPSVVAISSSTINPYDIDHRIEHVSGSGVIIDASGLILTNSHVVYGRQLLTVTLDGGVTLPAQLVGADPQFDIALIRIPKPNSGTLPVTDLADSERLLVGDDVYAIGNPLGLEQTLTRGIVSAVNRMLPGSTWSLTEPLIQTDAAINPGSSGGPLVDRCGALVGITTANLPDAQSIGFAVPANLIKSVIPSLLTNGRVIRPWFGVQGQFVVPVLKELLRVPLVDGFLVEVVEPGSPADLQGLHGGEFELVITGQPLLLGGDIITVANGIQLDEPRKLSQLLGTLKVGSALSLTVVRDGKPRQVELTLAERPLLPGDISAKRTSGPAGPSLVRSRQKF
ncbi:MAG: trypsin-like peptidase domain-containing protein [Acidobacteria bacterium]|nr:trypsin-like peptidase domain-containing protein [Acidobacteriota bacterium]